MLYEETEEDGDRAVRQTTPFLPHIPYLCILLLLHIIQREPPPNKEKKPPSPPEGRLAVTLYVQRHFKGILRTEGG